ncbi:phage shock protein PspA [Croceicoccus hydrothermalis]|uniref:phage shock protein PspA n=1 Tax=Croceicoccus hydrothermalis TaxID=2867964 RepID=UPI001EFA443E|nr:phage shock protein PspA [Croceicoccus hydrothermalis]
MTEPFDLEPEKDERRREADRLHAERAQQRRASRDNAAASRFENEVARLRRPQGERSGEPANGNDRQPRGAEGPRRFNDQISQYGAPLMGIFNRTRDIIAANFSDLLDKADDPNKMIRMIIMEMEETLVEVRASAARTIADQKEMQRHCGRLERLQDDWSEKAQLALSKDREDLARAALTEKKKATDLAGKLREEIAVLDDSLRACEEDILKLQGRLREARSRQTQIAARLESAENRVKLRTLLSTERVDEAMARFDQLERRVDYAEGRADALKYDRGGNRETSLAEQIEALGGDDNVDAELEELKRAMKGGNDNKGD